MEFFHDYFIGLQAIVDGITFVSLQRSSDLSASCHSTYQPRIRLESRLSHQSKGWGMSSNAHHNIISKEPKSAGAKANKERFQAPVPPTRQLPSGLITDEELLDSLKHDSTYDPTRPPPPTTSPINFGTYSRLDITAFTKAKAEGLLCSHPTFSSRYLSAEVADYISIDDAGYGVENSPSAGHSRV